MYFSLSFRSSSSSALSAAVSPESTCFTGCGGGAGAEALVRGLLVRPRPPNVSLGAAGGSSSTGDIGAGATGFFCNFNPAGAAFGGASLLGAGAAAGGASLLAGAAFDAAAPAGFFAPIFFGGALAAGGGGGGGGLSFAFTTALSKNSLILVFLISSKPSK